MKLICKLLSGSRMYALNTEESDYDYSGVFLNTKYSEILGLDRFDFNGHIIKSTDVSLFEFRHFLYLLQNTNTKVLEILFANQFIEKSEEFEEFQSKKYEFINSEKLYFSLKGYIESEKKRAIGQKSVSSEKRKINIEKYGFNPKNFSHLFRLCYSGIYFFKFDMYPINISEIDEEFHQFLLDLKTSPENYTKNQLLILADSYVKELDSSYKNKKNNYNFNRDLANEFCLKFYSPFIKLQI
jgi:predicted nucleotidyltransferase